MIIEHHTEDIDGVPVHYFPSDDEICQATLVFGVGVRNETAPTQGMLHAIEHLVMHEARLTPIAVDGSVDVTQTQFTATGSPPLVRAFLETICRALAEPPEQRLRTETKILAAELQSTESPIGVLHRARYGCRDLGLPDVLLPSPEQFASLILDCARRWFVTGNAFLIIDGAWPDGLRLPLRAGFPPARTWAQPRRWAEPRTLSTDAPICAFNLVLPPPELPCIDRLVVAVLMDRLFETIRHTAGLAYALEAQTTAIGTGSIDLLVVVEPRVDAHEAAAAELVRTFRGWSDVPPTKDELARAIGRVQEGELGRAAAIERFGERALDGLLGLSTPQVEVEHLQSITPDACAVYVRRIASDVVFLVGDEAVETLDRLGIPMTTEGPTSADPAPSGRVFRPTPFNRLVNRRARAASVTLNDRGLTLRLDGRSEEILWDQIAGVALVDADMVVFGLNGTAIPIGPGYYTRSKDLASAVTARVPDHLFYRAMQPTDAPDVRGHAVTNPREVGNFHAKFPG